MESADTGGHDDADTVAVEVGRLEDVAVGHGLTGCHQRILRVEVKLAELLAVDMVGAVEALYLAGKLGLEFRSVKMSDGCGAALAGHCGLPGGGYVVAQRSDGSESGHYNSL